MNVKVATLDSYNHYNTVSKQSLDEEQH